MKKIIERFSSSIAAHIQKFNPQKDGIDPEDISQEVSIKIWNLLKNKKKIKNVSSYIMRVVNSTIIDQIRASRRQARLQERIKVFDGEPILAENNYQEEKYKHIIWQAIESLKSPQQRVVRLFLLDMSIEEIAIFLNWSQDKTRNLLYRGLADLKKILKNEGVNYEN